MPLKKSQIARLIEKVDVYLQDNVDKFPTREEYDFLEDRVATIRYDFYSVGMDYDFPAIMMDLRAIIGKIGAVRNNPIKVKTRGINGGKSQSKVEDGMVVIYADEATAKTIRETFRVNHGVTPERESPITYKVGEVNRLIHYGFIDPAVGSQKRKRTSSILGDIFDFDKPVAPPIKRQQLDQDDLLVPKDDIFDLNGLDLNPSIEDFDGLDDHAVQDLLTFLDTELELPEMFGSPQGPPEDDTKASYYFPKAGGCYHSTDIFGEFGTDVSDFVKFRGDRNTVVYMDYLWNRYFLGSVIVGGGGNAETDSALHLFLSNRKYRHKQNIVSNSIDVLGDGKLRAPIDFSDGKHTLDKLQYHLEGIIVDKIFIQLCLELGASARHANVLVVDKTHKKLIRFEPHGAMRNPSSRIYNPMKVDGVMAYFVEKYLPGYTYVKPSDYIPATGVQIIEAYNENFAEVRDKRGRLLQAGGFCVAWTYLFIWMFDHVSVECNAKDVYSRFGNLDANGLALLIRRVMHYIYNKTKGFK
jgi:hypothetical protein